MARTPGCRAGPGRRTSPLPGQDSRLQGWTWQANLSLTWTGLQVTGLYLASEHLPYLGRTPGYRAGSGRRTSPLPGQASRLQGWTWQGTFTLLGQDSRLQGWTWKVNLSLAWAGLQVTGLNLASKHLPYLGRTPGYRAGPGRWTSPLPGQDSRLQGWTWQVNLSFTWAGLQVAGMDLAGEPLLYLGRPPGCRAGPGRWTSFWWSLSWILLHRSTWSCSLHLAVNSNYETNIKGRHLDRKQVLAN
jgi:hypothetical protein